MFLYEYRVWKRKLQYIENISTNFCLALSIRKYSHNFHLFL